MSFRFSMGRAQVKHFKTVLQTLNKIGGELLVEATPEELVLRAINTAKSAFISVTYFSRFFDCYEIFNAQIVQTVVLCKNALAVFRSQKISQIEFVLDNVSARLQATVHTDEGIIKRYAFNCLDGEILQTTVDRDAYPTVVIAEASELEKLLSTFQHSLDEITLIANPLSAATLANGHKACQISSFEDPLKGGQESALVTKLTLDTRSVFTSYSHSSPLAADVTFNVKDFRVMTALCTALGADVALRLEAAGAPLLVEPQFRGLREGAETDFQAMLILSTLTESTLGHEHLAQQQALEEQQQEVQEQQEQRRQGGPMQPQDQQPPQQQVQQRGQAQHQQQPSPAAAAAEAEPPNPLGGMGGAAGYGGDPQGVRVPVGGGVQVDGGGGGGGGAGAAATPAAVGRGRRRLPSRQDAIASGIAGGAATVAARSAYAAAAAAEGLPVAAADGGRAAQAADPRSPAPQGLRGPVTDGVGGPDAAVSGSVDDPEDDIPARRTGRPPRYDPVLHQRTAPNGDTALGAGAGGGRGGLTWGGDASFLRPERDQPLHGPTDPRVAAAARMRLEQPQPQYLQFPRGPGGARPGDSQDPEGLPGMRSPYGRQGHGQGSVRAVAAARSPSLGSYSVADPRVAPADSHRSAHAQGPWGGSVGAEGVGGDAMAGALAGAGGHGGGTEQPDPLQLQGNQYPTPQPCAYAAVGDPQQRGQQQQQMVVDHLELFGAEDDVGDMYDVAAECSDEDDEEVPATPPDQQQTRSMGAGVLGLGGRGEGAAITDQAG